MSTNERCAAVLEEIAQMMELLGQDRFRVAAHSRAARAVEGLSADITELAKKKSSLTDVDGIGDKLADKIIEFCEKGSIAEHAALKKEIPKGLLTLLNIPGLGPKTVRSMWQDGGITDLPGLEAAIADGSLLKLPRMGEKSVAKIKDSIAHAKTASDRTFLGVARRIADTFVAGIRCIKGVEQVEAAGSLRRGKETVGDVDILVATDDDKVRAAVTKAFTTAPGVSHIIASGDLKSSVHYRIDGSTDPDNAGPTIQVDLRILPTASWGSGLCYFTGSKEHNVRLRERALKMGMTLNEWGLFPEDNEPTPPQARGIKPVASRTEADIYEALKLPYIPPEMREDRGELDLPESPTLIEVADIKAELHAHTTASDGAMSIEELATLAKERGFHTIAVTDHSRSSAIAGGLQINRLMEHIEAVRSTTVKGITILAGSEVDILADGSLDYPDDILKQLDVVVASPHTALSQDPDTATKRLLKAIEHPLVHILGHPTGRLISRRPGLSPDMSKLIAAAKKHDVALEINAHWMRLDLRDTHIRAAVEAGCHLAIDCDVHTQSDYDNLRFGVQTGRRGWLTPDLCINTWPAKKLHAWLKAKR